MFGTKIFAEYIHALHHLCRLLIIEYCSFIDFTAELYYGRLENVLSILRMCYVSVLKNKLHQAPVAA